MIFFFFPQDPHLGFAKVLQAWLVVFVRRTCKVVKKKGTRNSRSQTTRSLLCPVRASNIRKQKKSWRASAQSRPGTHRFHPKQLGRGPLAFAAGKNNAPVILGMVPQPFALITPGNSPWRPFIITSPTRVSGGFCSIFHLRRFRAQGANPREVGLGAQSPNPPAVTDAVSDNFGLGGDCWLPSPGGGSFFLLRALIRAGPQNKTKSPNTKKKGPGRSFLPPFRGR